MGKKDEKIKCLTEGHKIRIIRPDDGEVPALCDDFCARCEHNFTVPEMENIFERHGVYCHTLYGILMAD